MTAASAAAATPGWASDGLEAPPDVPGMPLRPWRKGCLDIHHIATGRGDCTLVVGPDGSTLMIDAGASATPYPPAFPPVPDASRRPGEWIARYAQRRLSETKRSSIDIFLATHQHPDHIGDVDDHTPAGPHGSFGLTGVTDVDAAVPIRRLIDRGFPDYAVPARISAPFQLNYEAFVRARIARGQSVEKFRAGTLNQLRNANHASTYPEFSIRNLTVNGEVWTGEGESTQMLFPPLATLAQADIPEENLWSAAIRIAYGPFGYFTGGDLTASTYLGALPWRDVEAAAARVCGPVDVAVTPHHGMFDATSETMVRTLHPRVWVISAWHALHPSESVLARVTEPRLYPDGGAVLATGMAPWKAEAMPWLASRLASAQGHVIIRVTDAGRSYGVTVTDNSNEHDVVTKVLGPYRSGQA